VVIYPPYIIRNHSGLQLFYGHPSAEASAAGLVGGPSALAAAGQDVEVSSEPSLLASLLGLALGLSQGQDDDEEDVDRVPRPVAAAAPAASRAGGPEEGRGAMFCFSAGSESEAAAAAGLAVVQLGKLCLSVDGQVWSKALDLQRPAGTASVVELAVGHPRANAAAAGQDRLRFLGPRPVLEVAGAPARTARTHARTLIGGAPFFLARAHTLPSLSLSLSSLARSLACSGSPLSPQIPPLPIPPLLHHFLAPYPNSDLPTCLEQSSWTQRPPSPSTVFSLHLWREIVQQTRPERTRPGAG
jgi:hypothetical protein